jgi:hypothetical protein
MERVISAPAYIDEMNPITLEHIAKDPVTFRNRKTLAQYCNKNRLQCGALL